MLLPNNTWIKDTGSRCQWINCRVNTKLYDRTVQYRCCIQMRKCRCRSRVCQVIRRHIDCLYRCNRTVLCGCNSLLQCAHLRLQCRLISYSGWHTAKQRGYLRTCLCETENIVDEKKYVLSTFITEVFSKSQSGKTYSHTRSRRFVHLSEYHGRFLNNSGFCHFTI